MSDSNVVYVECPRCGAEHEVVIESPGSHVPASYRGNPDNWTPDESEAPELDMPARCPLTAIDEDGAEIVGPCGQPLGDDPKIHERAVADAERWVRESAERDAEDAAEARAEDWR